MPKPAPKPSALADLPQGWEIKKLEENVRQVSESFDPLLESSEIYISLEHIEQETGRILGVGRSESARSLKTKFRKNQILFGKLRPYLRKFAQPKFDGVCTTEIIVFTAKNKCILNDFIFYLIQSEDFIQKNISESKGTKMPRSSWESVSTFEYLLPPLLEQQRIASILSSVDALLERSRAVVTQLEQVRRGFVRRFLARGLSQSEDSVWPNVAISSVARVAQGYTFSPRYQGHGTGDYLYAKVSDMTLKGNEHFIHNAVNWVSEDVLQEMRIEPFSAGTIIFPRVGASLKTNKKRMLIKDSVIDDNLIAVIIEKKNLCSAHYFFEWLETIDLTSFCNEGPLPSITRSTIQKALLPLPPLEDQEQLIALLLPFDGRIQLQKAALENLSTLKKALMQYLLTGKYLTQPVTTGSSEEAL